MRFVQTCRVIGPAYKSAATLRRTLNRANTLVPICSLDCHGSGTKKVLQRAIIKKTSGVIDSVARGQIKGNDASVADSPELSLTRVIFTRRHVFFHAVQFEDKKEDFRNILHAVTSTSTNCIRNNSTSNSRNRSNSRSNE